MANSLPNWFVIANPAAGSGAVSKKWPNIKKQLDQSKIAYTSIFTTKKEHACELVAQAVQQGYRKIIAIGGDGTNYEVVNGIMNQQQVPSTDITYALLPVGTGNDWVKHYKIPRNTKQWIEMLKREKTFLQDVGTISYHQKELKKAAYFANVVGLAYDAFVVRKVEAKKKKVKNRIVYLLYLLRLLSQYEFKKSRLTINETQVLEDYFYTINLGICRYSGGGMQVVPHAISDDGYLALTLLRKLPKWKAVLNTRRLYDRSVGLLKECSLDQIEKIYIEHLESKAILVEADGEFLGNTPVEIGILKKSLKIVIPK